MLFSVIVPIYNVEKYIKRCIDSVLCQSYEDFELILVDDGSPDNCPRICDDYAAKDSRVKVIHKENAGLVSARQAGIQESCGEYIFNLDGDDALTADALENAYKIIIETKADMVSFSYMYYINGEIGAKEDDLAAEGLYHKPDMEEHIYPRLLSDKNMEHIFYFLWGKAIRRSLMIKQQLKVNTAISLGEDLSCVFPCYMDAETVYMSKKAVYLYTIRDDSISTSFKTHQLRQIADVIDGLRQMDVKKPRDFEAQIARYSCFMCFAILAAAAEGYHFHALKEIKKLISESIHAEEIKKARFEKLSPKSCIGITLMKANCMGLAFSSCMYAKKSKIY